MAVKIEIPETLNERGDVIEYDENDNPNGGGNPGSGGVTSYNDLTDTPCGVKLGTVDILPESTEEAYWWGVQFIGWKNIVSDLGLCEEGGSCSATLEINGEVINGTLSRQADEYDWYNQYGVFGPYSVENGKITFLEGSNISEGDTVTARMYAEAEIVVPLEEKYVPANVPMLSKADYGDLVIVSGIDENGKPIEYDVLSGKEKCKSLNYSLSKPNKAVSKTDQSITINDVDLYSKFSIELQQFGVKDSTTLEVPDEYYIAMKTLRGGLCGVFKNVGKYSSYTGASAPPVYFIFEPLLQDYAKVSVAHSCRAHGVECMPTFMCSKGGDSDVVIYISDETGNPVDTMSFDSKTKAVFYGYDD